MKVSHKKNQWEEEGWEDLWVERVRDDPSGGAIFGFGNDGVFSKVYSFSELDDRSHSLAASWRPLLSGRVVSLRLPNTPAWPLALLSLWRAGATPLLLPPFSSFAPFDSAAISESLAGASFRVVPGECGLPSLEKLNHLPAALPWPATLLKTVPSVTGIPRLIGFGFPELHADASQICSSMGISRDDRNFGAISFFHSYGFANLILPLLFFGIPLVCAPEFFPRSLLDGLLASKATVWPCVPAMLPGLLDIGFAGSKDLRLCVSAGARLSAKLAFRFREQCGIPVHGFYGSSECGGICYDKEGSAHRADGWVGTAMPEIKIRCFPAGTATFSRLSVSGKTVGFGYYPSSPEDALQNGAFLLPDFVEKTGEDFRVAGRSDGCLNLAGRKVYPTAVEQVLSSIPGVRGVAVFGIERTEGRGEEMAAIIDAPGIQPNEIRKLALSLLPDWQCPRLLAIKNKLPLTEEGKIDRAALSESLLSP